MVMTWDQVGEQRRLRPWRALLMLLVALAIFGAVCWLVCVERGN